ncbi:MAG TPA: mercuric reductase [Aliidongia sp.]|nr:mercuric reductase [Aliidongia sp.]
MTESKLGLPVQTRSSGGGAVVLTLGGLAAAFGVASCCGLPFLLAGAGLGTAWLYGVALVAAPHRLLLMTVAAVCLAGGAILLGRQRRQALCAPGSVCSKPAVQGLVVVGLLVGSALLYLGYRYA